MKTLCLALVSLTNKPIVLPYSPCIIIPPSSRDIPLSNSSLMLQSSSRIYWTARVFLYCSIRPHEVALGDLLPTDVVPIFPILVECDGAGFSQHFSSFSQS